MAATSANSSGRRRRLGEDARRAQIIRGCITVLAEDGYRQASLARIAQAAGVSKGLISHYFSDRDALMEQSAMAALNTVREQMSGRIDLTADVPDIIRAALRQVVQLQRTNAIEVRAINEVVRNLRQPDGTPRLDLRAYEDLYRGQERMFRRGQQDGTVRDFDTRVMAVTYQGAIDTMLGYLESHPETDPEKFADGVAELLIAAIRR
ncbi:TetR family transcriptional regulator [Microlunatus elymi]|uniref:TetR family transcriptional regulator n=1 Tax=Microlunatus elymi TaxID=2596828 RepID=A0A516PXL9_9ACTN|nr:TetR/AcrR family transcriptional regulator [Microlunatus elymi]QDP95918.1 TetR family transcriptional regulator [Microlunatus elymi]